MNATISTLLSATALLAFASTTTAQSSRPTGSRVPVNVTRGDPPAPLVVRPATCFESIRDQATGDCLQASTSPTFGVLFPYPGMGNVFDPPAFAGGGLSNHATGTVSTIAGGGGNTAGGAYAAVGGGKNNSASQVFATVGGGTTNAASGDRATIGGGSYNIATGQRSTVGGGQQNDALHTYAAVGGGGRNTASGRAATVAGGLDNDAARYFAAIGGGWLNTAYHAATVGGGRRNSALHLYATVGGGFDNGALGRASTVPGGRDNVAQASYSFAAGREAMAGHQGAFVWGDSFSSFPVPSLKTSSAPDEFNVYCSGGARLFTNSEATTGVLLAPGGGSWSSVSDRGAKENVESVDALAILERVVQMPLSTWNYKEQDDSIRHLGPMAQDFHAAFGLGVSDRLIDVVDSDGVALAAIQGLHAVVAEKEAEMAELRARLERLEELARTR